MIQDTELPGDITFEKMGVRSLAALHPPTYIHARMVSIISRCLAGHLADLYPALFDDVRQFIKDNNFRFENTTDSSLWKEQVAEYTYRASMCHDFGKIMIIDTFLNRRFKNAANRPFEGDFVAGPVCRSYHVLTNPAVHAGF